ncbi:Ion-translocating oxidoreductase complex subunit B [Sporomusa silvacetica DSM 10669]|uniref:Ion-translocating oxidoreductase complex subunit B n=1 Tax=Sporomusa silvacetica DSM 10669 TaxID=1123289 RepID=A0ABZ3IS53_9FIRM|nr:4Fe-4S dicluster domain-containing protein [Sporomusa silvacetica]OZC20699.1 ferredoxin [Sporomusa silvacetica DSM 10669]
MGHIVNAKEEVYRALAERLNRNPIGAPVNEDLLAILYRLYTESEAMVGSKFPIIPMTLDSIAGITGIKQAELKKTLDNMANKGLVVDIPRRDGIYYILAPMVIGFFEHTFMRVPTEVNLKEMAELFDKYFQHPEVGMEIIGKDTKFFQTIMYENLISAAVETEVLDYERASVIIRQSGGGGIGICACRHKASHQGKTCELNAPLETCISLGEGAEWLVRRGMAKAATVDELLKLLEQTEKLGLVHLCDNVLNQPAYMCNCCGCCCGVLRSAREYRVFSTHPSNFIPALEIDNCTGCGACAEHCPINAITMRDDEKGAMPDINKDICLGCGKCAAACPGNSLTMSRRSVLRVPPVDKTEQLTRIAREKDKMYFKLGPL